MSVKIFRQGSRKIRAMRPLGRTPASPSGSKKPTPGGEDRPLSDAYGQIFFGFFPIEKVFWSLETNW
jgi:hypothetical protein